MAIPSGRAGVEATLAIMSRLVKEGKKTPAIRAKAVALTSALSQKNWTGEIAALHKFVRDNIRYVKDINGVETVHTADAVLRIGSGDCDDKSILLASLLESIGHPTRFVAVGFQPGKFSHVFVQTRVGRNPGKWLSLETTEPVRVGWQPANVVSRIVKHN